MLQPPTCLYRKILYPYMLFDRQRSRSFYVIMKWQLGNQAHPIAPDILLDSCRTPF